MAAVMKVKKQGNSKHLEDSVPGLQASVSHSSTARQDALHQDGSRPVYHRVSGHHGEAQTIRTCGSEHNTQP